MPAPRRDHVIVTGAAGFIGSHLAEALLDRGRDVVAVDSFTGHYPAADKWANLSGLLGRPGFELHRLDLATADLRHLLAGAAAVFHLAAKPGVHTSFGPGFSTYLHDNVLATAAAGGLRPGAGPAGDLASSSSIYGRRAELPRHRGVQDAPGLALRRDQAAAEHLCQAYARLAESPMAVAMLRYFTVYGPRQRPDMGFRRFIEAALAGRPAVVYGDGTQTASSPTSTTWSRRHCSR